MAHVYNIGNGIRMVDYSNQVMIQIRAGTRRKVTRILQRLERFLKAEYRKPKTGRRYTVPGTNRTYIASAPGEYPARATGRMDRETLSTPAHVTGDHVTGLIGIGPDYAAKLQGLEMGPRRPLLVEARVMNQSEIERIMRSRSDYQNGAP